MSSYKGSLTGPRSLPKIHKTDERKPHKETLEERRKEQTDALRRLAASMRSSSKL